ncbi:response regulator transcription factor [Micromonospora sp. NPDC005220]|uniref:response regulator transcription factor n=1 Tax=Micromonospora sp. NPDC005220 TaxID=3155589 RepID=UPI0033BAD695
MAMRLRPDVVLTDIRMSSMDGLELTRLLTAAGMRVVVVTTFDLDEYVYAALRNGACGFLLKRSGPALVEGVRAAVAGDALISPQITVRLLQAVEAVRQPALPNPLTARETDIVRLVAQGLTNAQIGAQLLISAGTAKTHIANIQSANHERTYPSMVGSGPRGGGRRIQ